MSEDSITTFVKTQPYIQLNLTQLNGTWVEDRHSSNLGGILVGKVAVIFPRSVELSSEVLSNKHKQGCESLSQVPSFK